MIDLFKDDNTADIIKQSIQVHDMVLEKILGKKYIFMIGNKGTILDFIEDFGLEAEPLQINGDNMMSLKRNEGGFQHTYFIKKDENLRYAINIHGSENPNSIKADFDSLIGFELNDNNLKYLAFKKGEEFSVTTAERYINFVYPIAKVEEIEIFNKRANDVMESWFIDSINDGTITIR
jgi:hypothetical protein